ncbi:hypothetical protein AB0B45_50175 [Nonomuraea sp. NPDC049152]|uniref:helix-turn-helix transcriptional regulator n=1 Tax=Nonomuraea sp. NPDC049152 TaxID=3154350 RepID=UPI0033CE7FD0
MTDAGANHLPSPAPGLHPQPPPSTVPPPTPLARSLRPSGHRLFSRPLPPAPPWLFGFLVEPDLSVGPRALRPRDRPRLTADQAALAQQLYDTRDKTVQQIADLFGVPRSTVYGHLKGNAVRRQPKRAPEGP